MRMEKKERKSCQAHTGTKEALNRGLLTFGLAVSRDKETRASRVRLPLGFFLPHSPGRGPQPAAPLCMLPYAM